ncbi:hypothetical protein BN1110_02169 [bacterium YEK0313]|nr:hypothetical protein BN1110_02169 [bacterium YEK0313]
MAAAEFQPCDDGLVEAVYDTVMRPQRWPDVLDRLAAHAGCLTATLIATESLAMTGWVGNAASSSAMASFFRDGWAASDPTLTRALAAGVTGFVGDHALFSRDEIDSLPLYRAFRRPGGLGWQAVTVIDATADRPVLLSVHRPYDRGPVAPEAIARLNRLRPDLARAVKLSAQFKREQAGAAVMALARLGLPAAALAADGRMQAANAAFRDLMPGLAEERSDRLGFVDAAVDRPFRDRIECGHVDRDAGGLTLPVPAAGGYTLMVHLAPLPATAQDVFGTARWLVICARMSDAGDVDPALLQTLFGLTPAEVRVARGLASGETLSGLAAHHGLGRETVRSQLKSVMLKTKTHRQADLVRLLTRMARLDWA